MRNPRDDDFAGRRSTAADAKAALLRSHRAAKEAAEPTRVARQEERHAAAVAKVGRETERARVKLEEQERVHMDTLAAASAAKAEAEAHDKARQELGTLVVDGKAEKKAARDRRYASRKARRR